MVSRLTLRGLAGVDQLSLKQVARKRASKRALLQTAHTLLLQTATFFAVLHHTVIQQEDLARMPTPHCLQPPTTRITSKINPRLSASLSVTWS